MVDRRETADSGESGEAIVARAERTLAALREDVEHWRAREAADERAARELAAVEHRCDFCGWRGLGLVRVRCWLLCPACQGRE